MLIWTVRRRSSRCFSPLLAYVFLVGARRQIPGHDRRDGGRCGDTLRPAGPHAVSLNKFEASVSVSICAVSVKRVSECECVCGP